MRTVAMTDYFRFVLHHRGLVIAACVLLTVLAVISMSRATMATSLMQLVLGNHPAYLRYAERVQQFGSDEQLIVGFEADLASPAEIERLRRVVERVEALPDVEFVQSPLTMGEARPDGGLDVEALSRHPLAESLVVSADGRRIAVIAVLRQDEARAIEEAPGIAGKIVDVFVDEGLDREELHLGGIPAVLSEVHAQTVRNIMLLTPLVAVLLLLATWVLFRRLWPVLITLVVGALAIVWTMGFALAIDPQINIMLAICPALILIISFSDVVHLCSTYLMELSTGREKDEAILRTATEVGIACLFTSLTTLVGFLGLSLIKVPAFRHIGLVLGFGVAVALLLAMTLVPILFSATKPPRPWTGSLRSGSQHYVDVVLHGIRRLAVARPWAVIAAFGVLLAVSIWGTTRITIETDIVTRFPAHNALRRDIAWFNEHFAGISVVELYVQADEAVVERDPALLGRLERLQSELEQLPDVGKVVSLVNLQRAMSVTTGIWRPGTDPNQINRLVDLDAGLLRYTLLSRGTGMYAAYELGESARTAAERILGDDVEVEPSGMMYLSGMWLEENVRSQRRAILFSFGMIAVVMMLLFRSARVGLWSMVPNVLPLLALGGALGLFWDAVDSDMAVVALIAIGIAVDDTIHFVARYRREAARTASVPEALEATFGSAGRAIVMTSVIFAVGFAPFALSDYLSIRMIGILLPGVMIMALLADLLLLPALIAAGAHLARDRG
jgi:predicted RND superfamily exporter protein